MFMESHSLISQEPVEAAEEDPNVIAAQRVAAIGLEEFTTACV